VFFPTIFSASGYEVSHDESNFYKVFTHLKSYAHHFSSLFLFVALAAWFEILADNVLCIY